MTIDGVFYDEKSSAGQKILDKCKQYTDDEKHEIGEYKGFKLEIQFIAFYKSYRLYLSNNSTFSFELGNSDIGNITRIDNKIRNISENIKDVESDIENNKIQLEKARLELNKPFNQEQELKGKMERLNELNKLLNMVEKTHDILYEEENVANVRHENKKDYVR